MFKFMKGISKGNKLADQSARLCMSIVNYLISKGYDVRLPDTAIILKECLAICNLACMRANENPDTYGAKVVQAQDVLRDWLNNVFKASAKEYDFKQAVDEVIKNLPGYCDNWIRELLEEHPELKGKSLDEWIPSAASKFLIGIGFWSDQRYGKMPDKYTPTLMALLIEHVQKLA